MHIQGKKKIWLPAEQIAHLTLPNVHRHEGKEQELLGLNSNEHRKSPGRPYILLTKASGGKPLCLLIQGGTVI